MRFLMFFTAVLVMYAAPLSAKPYKVDPAFSRVSFAGTHAGNPFEGVFESWSAQINFEPADLTKAAIKVTFDLASAKTGNAMFDGTLPQSDWFDVANHPQAVFVSRRITAPPGGAFVAEGDLTIRGITQPVSFSFFLSDLGAAPVKMTAQVPIDRLAFDIGKKSDVKAEWVSQQINVKIEITAAP